jgi:hypothetical protein
MCHIAFFSCAAASAHFTRETLVALEKVDDDATLQRRVEASPQFGHVAAAHAHLAANNHGSTAPFFPPSARGVNGFWSKYSGRVVPQLQRIFTAHHELKVADAACKADSAVYTRVASCTSRNASRWLTTFPKTFNHVLNNDHLSLALRQRIDAPLFDNAPAVCECGEKLGDNQSHIQYCKRNKPPSTTLRHDIIQQALTNIARGSGVLVHQEMTHPVAHSSSKSSSSSKSNSSSDSDSQHQNLRPDLLMIGSSGTKLVDVTVRHPLAPSYEWCRPKKDDKEKGELRLLGHAERTKAAKYAKLALDMGAQFVPFACDVYGAMGQKAHELVEWFLYEAAANGYIHDTAEKRELRNTICTTLSVSIQRATAVSANNAMQRIRGDDARRVRR